MDRYGLGGLNMDWDDALHRWGNVDGYGLCGWVASSLPPLWIADQVRNDVACARPVDSRLRGNDGYSPV